MFKNELTVKGKLICILIQHSYSSSESFQTVVEYIFNKAFCIKVIIIYLYLM